MLYELCAKALRCEQRWRGREHYRALSTRLSIEARLLGCDIEDQVMFLFFLF